MLPRREPAVQRGDADPGPGRDLLQRGLDAALGEYLLGGGQDRVPVAGRVGSQPGRLFVHQPMVGDEPIRRRSSSYVTISVVEDALQIAGLTRRPLAWLCGITGLLAYNWSLIVPFKRGLMRSPNELFSNLEVSGQPYAIAMQRADIAAGVLLLLALLLTGRRAVPGDRREWLGMVVFAMAGVIGGLFPQVCADGINHGCLSAEWHFQL